MRWIWTAIAVACVSLTSAPAIAAAKAKPAPATSPLVGALERCRQIADPLQRLACFDAASGALVQAANTGQVRIVDRAQIQQAKRSLFGFSMPKLSLFSGDSDDDTADKLETTIKSVDQLNNGHYRIVLTEGDAVWETSEDKLSLDAPRRGQKITILRGALGSYFLRINGQLGVRGRRIS